MMKLQTVVSGLVAMVALGALAFISVKAGSKGTAASGG